MDDLKELEDRIGYNFKNKNLLKKAVTHSSYANINRLPEHSDNERLEFLGDAVLELISSEFLYKKFPDYDEGRLSKIRAGLVCEPTLSYCTEEIDLEKYILLSAGEEKTGGRNRKSIKSDAMEAVIGAIYLDGGFLAAKNFVFKFILTDIENKIKYHDCKTSLQEIVQAMHNEKLTYELVKEEGPDHDKIFYIEARIGDKVIGTGKGNSKKRAEQEAAFMGIRFFENKNKG